ncbi:hypothetical protein Chor_010457 [Crotalus horridus]
MIRIQTELQETVKDLAKGKKKYFETEQMAQAVREKADIEAKSKLSLFQSRISLQKASVKLKARRSECNSKATHARNEYLLTLAAANAHQDRYYQTDLVNIIKIGFYRLRGEAQLDALDGNVYDHLKDYLMIFSRTELEICQSVQSTFQFLLETSSRNVSLIDTRQVVRDYNFQLFLQENPVFHKPVSFQFQPCDSDTSFSAVQLVDIEPSLVSALRVTLVESRQLESETGTTEEHSLNKEARKWATRVAREHKNIVHSQRLNVDLEREDGEDGLDAFEDSNSSPSGTLRNYPLTCKVVYSYKASQPDELTIEEQEVLEVIEDGDMEDWVKARNKSGHVGYVPEKYLQFPTSNSLLSMLQSLAALDSRSHTSSNSAEAELVSGSLNGDSSVCFVKALYDYEGQTDEELSFPEGAIIRILNKENQDDDGFWEGEFNGHVGVFPSVLVEELTVSENGEVACLAEVQVFPSTKSQNSLAPLPLYDQPPASPFPSPDKRGVQGFPRSPSANVSENNFMSSSPGFSQPSRLLPESTSYGKLRPVRAAPPPPTQHRRPPEKIEDVEITLV